VIKKYKKAGGKHDALPAYVSYKMDIFPLLKLVAVKDKSMDISAVVKLIA